MDVNAIAEVFKALGDPQRLRIVNFLATQDPTCCTTGEGICACDLTDVTGLSQPTVSHHMKILLGAGIVEGEKRGKWMYYTLSTRGLRQVRPVLELLAGPPGTTSNEMTGTCCAPDAGAKEKEAV